ncbi:MAG: ABC transporter permease [Bacteroidia bacterium]
MTAPGSTNPTDSASQSLTPRKRALAEFKKRRINMIALRFLVFLVAVAVFADFLASNKPLLCKLNGDIHVPVVEDYLVDFGLYRYEKELVNQNWRELQYDWAIWPLVRYRPTDIDYNNLRLNSPFGKQRVKSWQEWHYLGTDRDGRDVLSGLIHGTRISLSIGLVAAGIAGLIGIIIGSIAGYFGDTRFQLSTIGIVMGGIGLVLGYFYGFQVRSTALSQGVESGALPLLLQLIFSFAILIGITVVFVWLGKPLERIPVLGRKRYVWLDIMISRLIEIVSTVPSLLLILTVMALTEKKSLFFLMLIIGLMSWPGVARYMRSEMLRTRNQAFVEAARAVGMSNFRILWRHAIPNSISPVLVVLTFGVAGAIATEAALTFIGVGLPDTLVTWGGLLNLARRSQSAWWLSLFPGIAIFLTITAINLVGEGLRDAFNPRLQNGQ